MEKKKRTLRAIVTNKNKKTLLMRYRNLNLSKKKLHIQFQFIYISHEVERFKEIKIVRIDHFSFESEIYCEVKQLKG